MFALASEEAAPAKIKWQKQSQSWGKKLSLTDKGKQKIATCSYKQANFKQFKSAL